MSLLAKESGSIQVLLFRKWITVLSIIVKTSYKFVTF